MPARRVTKLLQLLPCKEKVVIGLKERDRLARTHLLYSVYSGCTRWRSWSTDSVFLWWRQMLGTWSSEFSERSVLEYGKIQHLFTNSLFMTENVVFGVRSSRVSKELQSASDVLRPYTECIRSAMQHFQHLLKYWWGFIRLSKVYCHSESSPRFLHRLLNLGVWRNARGESGGLLTVKQDKNDATIDAT